MRPTTAYRISFWVSNEREYSRLSCRLVVVACVWAHSGRCLHRTNQLPRPFFLNSRPFAVRSTTATGSKKSAQNRLEFMGHCVPFYQCRVVGAFVSLFFCAASLPNWLPLPKKCHLPNDVNSLVNNSCHSPARPRTMNECEKINSIILHSLVFAAPIRFECRQMVAFHNSILWNWWNGNWYRYYVLNNQKIMCPTRTVSQRSLIQTLFLYSSMKSTWPLSLDWV